eukprot:COSAG02_NODE_1267_length_13538_cov_11.820746_7_plen_406_part_00
MQYLHDMERVDGGRHRGCAIATTAGLESCVQSRAMSHVEVESLERVIWPEDAARRRRCRELWASENFRYGDAEHPEWGRVGLVQVNNGPCGVLAAIQARAISRLIVAHEGRTRQASATTEHLVEALATCLEDAATTESVGDTPQLQRCCVVLPTAPPEGHSCFCLKEASGCGLRSVLAAHIDSFDLVALLRSLVATRGAERVAAELRESGELCLVVGDSEAQLTGQMGFCSESLLMLCITGCANNALDPDPPPRSPPQIGITAEPGLPGFFVGPWLKNPDRPVWVLRWGAHYSCVWRDSKRLWHYNGAAGARAFDSVLVGEDEVSNEQQGMNTELAGRGKVLTLIQRRPVAELDSRSEIHVLWEVAPQPQKLYPEPEPEFEEPSASGDKWVSNALRPHTWLHMNR